MPTYCVWSTTIYLATATDQYPQVVDSFQDDFSTWLGVTTVMDTKATLCLNARFLDWNWEVVNLDNDD